MDYNYWKTIYPDAKLVTVERMDRVLSIDELAVREYGHTNVKCLDSSLKSNRGIYFDCSAIFSLQAFSG